MIFMGETPRVGVWVCECGGNIGDVVEADRVVDELKPEITFVRKERYL